MVGLMDVNMPRIWAKISRPFLYRHFDQLAYGSALRLTVYWSRIYGIVYENTNSDLIPTFLQLKILHFSQLDPSRRVEEFYGTP